MLKKIISVLTAASLGAFAFGCYTETEYEEDVPAPVFEGEGQVAAEHFEWGVDYPQGPYGFTVGSIIPDLKLMGYISFVKHLNDGIFDEATGRWRQVIRMSDLYNPTGEDVFPEGSLYGSLAPKPKALMIDISAAWCGPCNDEAEHVLNNKYYEYFPQGGQIMVALLQDTEGYPSKLTDLDLWVQSYQIPYLSVIGGSSPIMIFLDGAWPTNFLIDLRTMQIVKRITGGPAEPDIPDCNPPPWEYVENCNFWPTFEQIIAGTFVYTE